MNPSTPTVSVHIVTYNSAGDIVDCLEAVMRQSYPIECIVVLDNASADDTLQELERFRDRDKVKIIASAENTGFAGGQNRALAAAESDYALVLNPDVRLHPDYVRVLVEFLERHPETGSACGMLIRSDAKAKRCPAALPEHALLDSAGLVMDAGRQVRDAGAGEPAAGWMTGGEVFGVSGAAAVYRRAMIGHISVGGQFFDEQFFAYKEDVDAAWRAQLLGWKAYYVPDALASHARGWKEGGRRSIPLFVRRHSYQNRWFTLLKNERWGRHLWKTLPIIAVTETLKLGYILVKEPALLGCWLTIACLAPDMLRKRREIRRKMEDTSGALSAVAGNK
ncbi:glycosyltransferase family 2 protein [Paenibacillus beijingensis]|uniref:Glycosyltransferase 2-like domain-containing protein n=1 Tax=Paenibacillus beijingensis TaxID=1126833 RepID=A0A0D5NGR4_9BACL|nr:glycosyltransferase family 2 protein [Paenibacillus beijingensis]AJY74594.1 hypothetical protein VN24_08420 [Paenibacillus beijingensis]